MDSQTKSTFITVNEVKIPADLSFLIVEDEPDIQELLVETLNELGFCGNYQLAKSVEEALSISSKAINDGQMAIDFIISDWNLADLSGLDFLIKIRSETAYKNTPFLMVTGNDNVSGMLVATKRGASEYLVKPWEEDEFAEKVASCWESRLPDIPLDV